MVLGLAGPLPTIQVGLHKSIVQLGMYGHRICWLVVLGPSCSFSEPHLQTLQVGLRDCMEVMKTEFVGFSLATFLANTGGSLGLWLGLGLLQLAQILVQQASFLACKFFD